MNKNMIRIWQQIDTKEVKEHLLLAGELSANCENCQHLGIDFFKEKSCPKCKTEFRYIGFRSKQNKAEELSVIRRIAQLRPELIIVDYADIKRACGKSQAHKLLE